MLRVCGSLFFVVRAAPRCVRWGATADRGIEAARARAFVVLIVRHCGRGSGAHYNMAKRLRYAKLKGLLNETQLAELAQLEAPPGSKSRKVWSAGRVDALMTEIRALGRIPRRTAGHEDALYNRMYYVKANNLLSDSQLAELAELPAGIASVQDP